MMAIKFLVSSIWITNESVIEYSYGWRYTCTEFPVPFGGCILGICSNETHDEGGDCVDDLVLLTLILLGIWAFAQEIVDNATNTNWFVYGEEVRT
ncbi:hypothetical protein VNO78_21119 [Psophocarpus tetragonolobus]|uniref:Uncharacterized protein n=1 Tax=Psophocarpus tetragonolobus TaxID=3891 RepID=A0AAN9SCN8_PSOTE